MLEWNHLQSRDLGKKETKVSPETDCGHETLRLKVEIAEHEFRT